MLGELIVQKNPPERLLRLGIIGAVLFLSAYLGHQATVYSLLLILVVLGGLVLLRWPVLGFPALIISSLTIPFALGTGTQTKLHLGILLIPALVAIWVLDMIRHRSVRLAQSPANLPLLLLAVSATISLLAGNLTWDYFAHQASVASQLGGWSVFVLSVGVFLLAANQIPDLRWLQLLTAVLLLLGAVAVVVLWYPSVPIIGQVVVVDVQAESLFWVWLVALAGGVGLFDRSNPPIVRIALLLLAGTTVAGGWHLRPSWVSGWLPPLVVLVTLIFLRSWRLGLIVTVTGFAGIALLNPNLLTTLAGLKQYSTDTRLAAWEILLSHIIPMSPVIGLGPANYYFYTQLFPILGWYVSFNSHNQYVDILAQTGVLGLFIFSWTMLSIGYVGWNLRDRAEAGFAQAYVYACLAGLLGTVVSGWFGDWVLPFVYNIGLAGFRASMLAWLFLGGLVVIDRITRSQVNSPSTL